jgi:3-deoxy-D-manno-octulosonate 8-phosphate phosphatase (KDO 8-P phosphatase)
VLKETGISAAETAYVGDDLLDLVVMRRAGFPIAVANAAEEVKQVARLVTRRRGGDAAVREAIEHLLKAAGRWETAMTAIGANRE